MMRHGKKGGGNKMESKEVRGKCDIIGKTKEESGKRESRRLGNGETKVGMGKLESNWDKQGRIGKACQNREKLRNCGKWSHLFSDFLSLRASRTN